MSIREYKRGGNEVQKRWEVVLDINEHFDRLCRKNPRLLSSSHFMLSLQKHIRQQLHYIECTVNFEEIFNRNLGIDQIIRKMLEFSHSLSIKVTRANLEKELNKVWNIDEAKRLRNLSNEEIDNLFRKYSEHLVEDCNENVDDEVIYQREFMVVYWKMFRRWKDDPRPQIQNKLQALLRKFQFGTKHSNAVEKVVLSSDSAEMLYSLNTEYLEAIRVEYDRRKKIQATIHLNKTRCVVCDIFVATKSLSKHFQSKKHIVNQRKQAKVQIKNDTTSDNSGKLEVSEKIKVDDSKFVKKMNNNTSEKEKSIILKYHENGIDDKTVAIQEQQQKPQLLSKIRDCNPKTIQQQEKVKSKKHVQKKSVSAKNYHENGNEIVQQENESEKKKHQQQEKVFSIKDGDNNNNGNKLRNTHQQKFVATIESSSESNDDILDNNDGQVPCQEQHHRHQYENVHEETSSIIELVDENQNGENQIHERYPAVSPGFFMPPPHGPYNYPQMLPNESSNITHYQQQPVMYPPTGYYVYPVGPVIPWGMGHPQMTVKDDDHDEDGYDNTTVPGMINNDSNTGEELSQQQHRQPNLEEKRVIARESNKVAVDKATLNSENNDSGTTVGGDQELKKPNEKSMLRNIEMNRMSDERAMKLRKLLKLKLETNKRRVLEHNDSDSQTDKGILINKLKLTSGLKMNSHVKAPVAPNLRSSRKGNLGSGWLSASTVPKSSGSKEASSNVIVNESIVKLNSNNVSDKKVESEVNYENLVDELFCEEKDSKQENTKKTPCKTSTAAVISPRVDKPHTEDKDNRIPVYMNERRRQRNLQLNKENANVISFEAPTTAVINESPRVDEPHTEDKDNIMPIYTNERRRQRNLQLNKENPESTSYKTQTTAVTNQSQSLRIDEQHTEDKDNRMPKYSCQMCGLDDLETEVAFVRHMNGRKHQRNVELNEESSPLETVSSSSAFRKRNICEICGTGYLSKHDYEHHMKGNRHLENVIAYKNNKRVLRSAPARNKCEICNLDFMSDHDYEAHMKGSRHRDQACLVGIKPERIRSISPIQLKYHFCEICGIGHMSDRDYNVHLGGSKHRDRARLFGIVPEPINTSSKGNCCGVCRLRDMSDHDFEHHMNGTAHKNAVLAQGFKSPKKTVKKSIVSKSNCCEICGLRDMSDHDFEKHMHGNTHRNAAIAKGFIPPKIVKHPPPWKRNSCDICETGLMSDHDFTNHVKGSKHLANVVARQRRTKSPLSTATNNDTDLSSDLSHKKWFSCVECGIPKMDRVSYMNHIQGNRHKFNIRPSTEDFKQRTTDSKPEYSCDLCGIPKLDGIKPYKEHVRGRRHQEAMQRKAKRENDGKSSEDTSGGWILIKSKKSKTQKDKTVGNYDDNYKDDSAGFVDQSHQVGSTVYTNNYEDDLGYDENYEDFDYNDYENPYDCGYYDYDSYDKPSEMSGYDDVETNSATKTAPGDETFPIEIVDDYDDSQMAQVNQIQALPTNTSGPTLKSRNNARVMNKYGSSRKKIQDNVNETCKNCGCIGFDMIKCTTCRSSSYCSEYCQASHAHIHENECHLLKEINDLKDRLKEKNDKESEKVSAETHRIDYKDCALKSMQECLADAKSCGTLSMEELSRVSKRIQFWKGSKFSHSEDVSRAASDISSLIADLEKDKIFCSDCECWVSSGQEWTLHSNSREHMNAIAIHDELNVNKS
eukprot:TRINITY_DN900_c0_g1_i1.p1 TRINITY_DN900_c0_g1~~TRINITY_DN900_c0_g1_i1.p1  ORF type:complete len:1933 (+),score=525.31 TRINITY_DN900_c0_g1_i1:741-5801(+)